jgi:hypothetical protein
MYLGTDIGILANLTMGGDRLNDIMVDNLESYTARHLDIDEAINKFASIKMHRYPPKY